MRALSRLIDIIEAIEIVSHADRNGLGVVYALVLYGQARIARIQRGWP